MNTSFKTVLAESWRETLRSYTDTDRLADEEVIRLGNDLARDAESAPLRNQHPVFQWGEPI